VKLKRLHLLLLLLLSLWTL